MAKIKPFRAVRPIPELAAKVAALPYDVMDSEEARERVQGNPYSFLYIDKAEIDLPLGTDLYSEAVYERASQNFEKFKREGIFIQDELPSLYIYQQVMDGRVQRGLVASASVDDYLENKIKKHELTRVDKEEDRTKHIEFCNANTGPIFLTYRSNPLINKTLQKWTEQNKPIYDFISEDGVGHRVWQIEQAGLIKELTDALMEIDPLYIADGHHRSASAVNVALKRRKTLKGYIGNEEFNYFLAVLFPHEDLKIMDYNRVVKDLNGLTTDEFLQKVEENFIIEKAISKPFRPKKNRNFGMYLDGEWYKLTAKEGSFNKNDPVLSLDISILQNNLLNPILGIFDPRTDERIDFIGGIRGLGELERRVEQGMKVAFSMYPTTIEELMEVADANQLMPPKSTWFEPKLRSGLFIHDLE